MALDFSFLCLDTITLETASRCFNSQDEETYLDWLISAWGWTSVVAVGTLILAFSLACVIGILRTLRGHSIIRTFSDGYVELFRNIPILVQVFIWYHVVPFFIPIFEALPGFILVIFALGFYSSARISEHIKAGILSRSKDQINAAYALGMTTFQAYRLVLLPSTFRVIIPSLTSEMMSIVKNSSVAFAVSVAELTQYAMQVQEEVAHGIEIYMIVTVLYMLSAFLVYLVMSTVEKQINKHNHNQLA